MNKLIIPLGRVDLPDIIALIDQDNEIKFQ